MTDTEYDITTERKALQFTSAFLILLSIWKLSSFKTAVLAGLAMNSADLNEARERLSNQS